MLKFLLTACLGLFGSVSADQHAPPLPSFDAGQGILKLPIVKALGQLWSAELKDQGGFHFKLLNAVAFSGPVPDVYPILNIETGILSVPDLKAYGKAWNIALNNSGNDLFTLAAVHEASETITARERYSIQNDGTVIDITTGLQWMRCSYGQTWTGSGCAGNLLRTRMEDAIYAAYSSRFAGKNDWRLPTIYELQSLIYCSSGVPNRWNSSGRACEGEFQRPAISLAAFPDAPRAVYWSSTPLMYDPGEDYSLTVSFNYGHIYYSYFNDAYEVSRFVRGQSKLNEEIVVVGGFKE